jgi:hypothetical protein
MLLFKVIVQVLKGTVTAWTHTVCYTYQILFCSLQLVPPSGVITGSYHQLALFFRQLILFKLQLFFQLFGFS